MLSGEAESTEKPGIVIGTTLIVVIIVIVTVIVVITIFIIILRCAGSPVRRTKLGSRILGSGFRILGFGFWICEIWARGLRFEGPFFSRRRQLVVGTHERLQRFHPLH